MKNKTEKELIKITWNDAYHLTDTWLSVDGIAESYKEQRFQVVNVGWNLFEDKKYIILAGKHSKDFQEWGFVMMIPKGMIVKIEHL